MLRQGDNVFYSDNGKGMTDYCGAAFRVIRDLGLTPLAHGGAGLDARKSNFDKEIRDDFYQSKVVILFLGKGEGWKTIEDNWALPELKQTISFEIKCFVYVLARITKEEIKSLNLPIDPAVVENKDYFETILKQNLLTLLK